MAVRIVVEPNYRMTELLQRIERKGASGYSSKEAYKIRHFKLKDIDEERQRMDFVLSVPEEQYTTEIYYYIKKIDHVLSVEIENL